MTFRPGVSGNPGGRPVNAARAAALPHVKDAVAYYAAVLKDLGETTDNRLKAADRLLDRAIGRPTQTTQLSGMDGDEIITRVLYGWAEAKPDVPA